MSKMISVPVIPRKSLDKLRELFPEAFPVSRLSAHNVSGLSAAILILESPPSTFGRCCQLNEGRSQLNV